MTREMGLGNGKTGNTDMKWMTKVGVQSVRMTKIFIKTFKDGN